MFASKYFREVLLLILVLMVAMLIWQSRYSYVFALNTEEDGSDVREVYRINNITGKGCMLDSTELSYENNNINIDLTKCIKMK